MCVCVRWRARERERERESDFTACHVRFHPFAERV